MAAYTLPASFAVGEVLTAATMNKLRTCIAFLAGVAGANVGTSQTTTSTSFTTLSTAGPAATATVGTHALVVVSCYLYNATAADTAQMSFVASGANTISATTNNSLQVTGTKAIQASRMVYLSGLTAGSTTFTAKYRAVTGGTAHFASRQLTVIPVP